MNPFEKLLVDLTRSKILFVTVGGIACAFNGLVRSTEDVDILIHGAENNVNQFLVFLESYSPLSARELSLADFCYEEGAIRIVEDFPLDVFVLMKGHRYQDLEKYIKKFQLDNAEIPYLGKEGLILLKSDSLREVDQKDVVQLKELLP